MPGLQPEQITRHNLESGGSLFFGCNTGKSDIPCRFVCWHLPVDSISASTIMLAVEYLASCPLPYSEDGD